MEISLLNLNLVQKSEHRKKIRKNLHTYTYIPQRDIRRRKLAWNQSKCRKVACIQMWEGKRERKKVPCSWNLSHVQEVTALNIQGWMPKRASIQNMYTEWKYNYYLGHSLSFSSFPFPSLPNSCSAWPYPALPCPAWPCLFFPFLFYVLLLLLLLYVLLMLLHRVIQCSAVVRSAVCGSSWKFRAIQCIQGVYKVSTLYSHWYCN